MDTYKNIETGSRRVDLGLLISYLLLILFGWVNIYAAVYSEEHTSIFDFSQRYGMQFIWIIVSTITAIFILYIINPKIYSVLSPVFYVIMLVLLAAVIFLGKEVNGSKSWFFIGSFAFQPAEFSKITTSLLLAYVMSQWNFSLATPKQAVQAVLIVLVPILLIIMEKETGSALVYLGLILVFYREGLPGWVLVLGLSIIALFIITIVYSPLIAIMCVFGVAVILMILIKSGFKPLLYAVPAILLMYFIPRLAVMTIGERQPFRFLNLLQPQVWGVLLCLPLLLAWGKEAFLKQTNKQCKFLLLSIICALAVIFSVEFVFNKVLQPHQKARIENLLGITQDLQGIGYNVHQSKIAIGSGGLAGKGFLNGTQTKYNFVPEQSTDFIFCTVGEEWGFAGSVVLLGLYIFLIIRIIIIAEKNSEAFTRIYGYCVASIFAMHVFINMGMTMGVLPVIGIPLPFLSYGGSSMLSFTILLFIFIRLDHH